MLHSIKPGIRHEVLCSKSLRNLRLHLASMTTSKRHLTTSSTLYVRMTRSALPCGCWLHDCCRPSNVISNKEVAVHRPPHRWGLTSIACAKSQQRLIDPLYRACKCQAWNISNSKACLHPRQLPGIVLTQCFSIDPGVHGAQPTVGKHLCTGDGNPHQASAGCRVHS